MIKLINKIIRKKETEESPQDRAERNRREFIVWTNKVKDNPDILPEELYDLSEFKIYTNEK